MSPIRERFVKIIEELPYELEEEILKRDTMDILEEITLRYVENYGTDDLSKEDKECIESLLGNPNDEDQEKNNEKRS